MCNGLYDLHPLSDVGMLVTVIIIDYITNAELADNCRICLLDDGAGD